MKQAKVYLDSEPTFQYKVEEGEVGVDIDPEKLQQWQKVLRAYEMVQAELSKLYQVSQETKEKMERDKLEKRFQRYNERTAKLFE